MWRGWGQIVKKVQGIVGRILKEGQVGLTVLRGGRGLAGGDVVAVLDVPVAAGAVLGLGPGSGLALLGLGDEGEVGVGIGHLEVGSASRIASARVEWKMAELAFHSSFLSLAAADFLALTG